MPGPRGPRGPGAALPRGRFRGGGCRSDMRPDRVAVDAAVAHGPLSTRTAIYLSPTDPRRDANGIRAPRRGRAKGGNENRKAAGGAKAPGEQAAPPAQTLRRPLTLLGLDGDLPG